MFVTLVLRKFIEVRGGWGIGLASFTVSVLCRLDSKSRNSPGFDPRILQHMADKAVLFKVRKKIKSKKKGMLGGEGERKTVLE